MGCWVSLIFYGECQHFCGPWLKCQLCFQSLCNDICSVLSYGQSRPGQKSTFSSMLASQECSASQDALRVHGPASRAFSHTAPFLYLSFSAYPSQGSLFNSARHSPLPWLSPAERGSGEECKPQGRRPLSQRSSSPQPRTPPFLGILVPEALALPSSLPATAQGLRSEQRRPEPREKTERRKSWKIPPILFEV